MGKQGWASKRRNFCYYSNDPLKRDLGVSNAQSNDKADLRCSTVVALGEGSAEEPQVVGAARVAPPATFSPLPWVEPPTEVRGVLQDCSSNRGDSKNETRK